MSLRTLHGPCLKPRPTPTVFRAGGCQGHAGNGLNWSRMPVVEMEEVFMSLIAVSSLAAAWAFEELALSCICHRVYLSYIPLWHQVSWEFTNMQSDRNIRVFNRKRPYLQSDLARRCGASCTERPKKTTEIEIKLHPSTSPRAIARRPGLTHL